MSITWFLLWDNVKVDNFFLAWFPAPLTLYIVIYNYSFLKHSFIIPLAPPLQCGVGEFWSCASCLILDGQALHGSHWLRFYMSHVVWLSFFSLIVIPSISADGFHSRFCLSVPKRAAQFGFLYRLAVKINPLPPVFTIFLSKRILVVFFLSINSFHYGNT